MSNVDRGVGLSCRITFCGFAKVAIFTTKLPTKHRLQIYEKLFYEAMYRHFCKTAVRCWRSCQSLVCQCVMDLLYAINMSNNLSVSLCVGVLFISEGEGFFLIFCLRLATCKLFDKALFCALACAALAMCLQVCVDLLCCFVKCQSKRTSCSKFTVNSNSSALCFYKFFAYG